MGRREGTRKVYGGFQGMEKRNREGGKHEFLPLVTIHCGSPACSLCISFLNSYYVEMLLNHLIFIIVYQRKLLQFAFEEIWDCWILRMFSFHRQKTDWSLALFLLGFI